ncbi:MAG: hypothetical protein GFH27_549305n65 [Chloroflexi bacterium AL-W]|nr:hypothetical protein [Chloroflexi bacterium AL-N1]NOK69311.1 hypothetical protein [Chloroflexi bacterium AL-N10]NOK76372.1 hypothetical protein [Chloroflexi bacterium AL-N5]NOK83489.1 hypothetical protein [Chloroflexi bacterium AL-W]NOK91149.1 hypothetical protein [Chloroflexi bacterium AL-N15]
MRSSVITKLSMTLACTGVILVLISLAPLINNSPEQPIEQIDQVNYGKMLFTAKGCASCHQHDVVVRHWDFSVGPNLTYYAGNPDYVREWLQDPSAIRTDARMPDLDLSDEEIEALVVFLQTSVKQ